MRPRALPLLLAALAALGSLSCAERDPLEELLERVVDAAEDRDPDALAELLTDDFRTSEGGDRAETLRTARQFLLAYRALDADMTRIEMNRRGSSGRATFRLTVSGTPTSFGGLGDLVPNRGAWDFEITAREDAGSWKLASASWREVTEQ